MSNAYAGITNLIEGNELAQFDYLGYRIIVDTVDKFAAIQHPLHGDFRTTLNSAGRNPKMKDFIRAAKEATAQAWKRRNEDEKQHRANEIMAKVDESNSRHDWPTIGCYTYKGYEIEIIADEYGTECPWDDWDQEPSAMSTTGRGFGGWSHAYGKNDIGSIPDYRIPADVGRAEFAIRYIQIAHGGVAEEFHTSSQRYVAYFTGEEIDKWFDGDKEFARMCLTGSIATFEEWAEYGPHGFRVTLNGDEIEDGSLWGIYAHGDHSYAVGEAIAVIDSDIKARKEESLMWEEEIRGEIEAETGQPVNLAR